MKSILITGGSKGLGKELVKSFINKGYKVYYTYHSTLPDISMDNCTSIKCDLRSDEDIYNLVSYIKENGGVDVLVNNAAVEYDTSVDEKTRDSFKEVFDVNLFGPFLLSRELGKLMYENKYGKIINISSNNSIDKYDPVTLEYDCSKASLNLLTKIMAKELAPYVNVNEFIKSEEENILLNRFATCEDIANLVVFLASDDANYINGELIRIDGGNK